MTSTTGSTFDPKSPSARSAAADASRASARSPTSDDPSGTRQHRPRLHGQRYGVHDGARVGHAHGRNHAPGCGASGIDPGFPSSYIENSSSVGQYGTIGVIGYDITARVHRSFADRRHDGLLPADLGQRLHYQALATRVATINGAADDHRVALQVRDSQPIASSTSTATATSRGVKPSTCATSRCPAITPYLPGRERQVHIRPPRTLHKLDHADGGYLIVPEGPAGFASIKVTNVGARDRPHVGQELLSEAVDSGDRRGFRCG